MPDQPPHVCPYAAALSEDEDDASHHSSPAGGGGGPPKAVLAEEALSAARRNCPAFANRACPFRAAGSDPDAMREVMRQVPPSHFPTRSVALQGALTSKNEGGAGEAATPFQLAMEHVHRVSSAMTTAEKDAAPATNGPTAKRRSSLTPENRDSFVLRGGCPFKQFHSGKSFDDQSTHLARAMEDFSLAAIMGRMAEESLGEEELEGMGEGEVGEGESWSVKDGEDATAAIMSDEQPHVSQSIPKVDEEGADGKPSSLLSHALKTGTAESHTAAENVHFVNNFIKGDIDRDLYAEMVAGLYHTYVVLERLLDEHAPTYFGTLHFPQELGRTETLKEDMEFWHGLGWEATPAGRTPSPAVLEYANRLEEIGRLDPLLLLSHAYTRYLGDLSGGKVLSRVARRALRLEGHDGLHFYKFDHVPSAKRFKDHYREALDGLELTPSQVGKLVAEANVAFALNMRVFEELDVRGGVPGARVRDVREALAYYDVEMEHQAKEGRPQDRAEEEEAKCPFGFVGGPNPHKALGGKSTTEGTKDGQTATDATASSNSTLTASVPTPKKDHAADDGRCPWPFVFFHDPATGMRDWQTWFVVGLVLCWCWSQIQ